jgi:hypothetical protein
MDLMGVHHQNKFFGLKWDLNHQQWELNGLNGMTYQP